MRAELYGVGAANPAVVFAVAATLSIIALVAIAIPSWRASRISPATALGS